jgi:hypothetical protein
MRNSPQYAVEADGSSIYWISTGNTVSTSWALPVSTDPANQFLDFDFWSFGNSVYWVHSVYAGTQGYLTGSGVFAVDSATKTQRQLSSLDFTFAAALIADVNTQSILITDTTAEPGTLYRLPNSSSASPPVTVTSFVGSNGGNVFQGVTEDSNGIYWLDGAGTVYRCSASSCTNTKVTLATGQTNTIPSGFYQDSTALYFTHRGPYQIMRLAK